jgi:Fe-S cluster biogenesis protein NfuA
MIEDVKAALESVRPALQRDGGDVELVDVTDGVVKVRLNGACASCSMASWTLEAGIELTLKDMVPGVREVVRV